MGEPQVESTTYMQSAIDYLGDNYVARYAAEITRRRSGHLGTRRWPHFQGVDKRVRRSFVKAAGNKQSSRRLHPRRNFYFHAPE